jgi:hypothetical protein
MSAVIYKNEVTELIKSLGSKVFTVEFVKKDGSLRVMNARLGVKKHLKGGSLGYDAKALDLLPVFDMREKGYRMIQLNTVNWIKCDGVTYNVRG